MVLTPLIPTGILKVEREEQIPGHSMYGDWALPGQASEHAMTYIDLEQLFLTLVPGRITKRVFLENIAAKPSTWFGGDDFEGERFDKADPSIPGMLVRGMGNPLNLPYRMIDGRRRLEKLRRRGLQSADFYVFRYFEIEHFIREVRVAK